MFPPDDDSPRFEVKQPAWCPRCCRHDTVLTFDPDTFTWTCSGCAGTWPAEPERRQ